MTPSEARALTFQSRVQRTVDENLEEVRQFASAGNSGSYFKTLYKDPAVNQEAAEKLRQSGYNVELGHVTW